MENRFKQRISRMFCSSLGSCRSRNLSDIFENPVFVPQNHRNFHMIEPLSPKPRPFPPICRPRCPETDEPVENSCIVSKDAVPRQKVSERYSLFVPPANMKGRMCPPASPISPLNAYKFHEFESKEKEKRSKKKKKTKTRMKNKNRETCLFSSSSGDANCGRGNGGWFSSEDETETLFSSRSLSSDSSESRRTRHRRKTNGTRRRRGVSKSSELGLLPLQGKVKDSFAVVKRSSDPHSDFRTSMVEMIVEKQIFASKDLEQLLQCFLSLNSYHHHRVIIEVFTEIWEALFSNWS